MGFMTGLAPYPLDRQKDSGGKEPGGTLIVPIQDEMAGFFAGAYEPVDREAIDHLIVNILR